MQYKELGTYKLTHFNGMAEELNAESMEQAIENMTIPESSSPVVSASRIGEPVRTVIPEMAEEISFSASAVLEDGSLSEENLSTPASGTVHVGDTVSLRAVPARNYSFVAWKMNGTVISENASLSYKIPETDVKQITFTAVFKLSDVAWTAEVSPSEATGEGCLAFPSSGTTKADGAQELLAVAKGSYKFDHWERNGESVGTNEILKANVKPLAEGEELAVYTAVFTL
nr:MAG TPA: PKD-like domain [Caudoviricetes sp.]